MAGWLPLKNLGHIFRLSPPATRLGENLDTPYGTPELPSDLTTLQQITHQDQGGENHHDGEHPHRHAFEHGKAGVKRGKKFLKHCIYPFCLFWHYAFSVSPDRPADTALTLEPLSIAGISGWAGRYFSMDKRG
jgi:hypothetical protein